MRLLVNVKIASYWCFAQAWNQYVLKPVPDWINLKASPPLRFRVYSRSVYFLKLWCQHPMFEYSMQGLCFKPSLVFLVYLYGGILVGHVYYNVLNGFVKFLCLRWTRKKEDWLGKALVSCGCGLRLYKIWYFCCILLIYSCFMFDLRISLLLLYMVSNSGTMLGSM